MSGIAQNLRHRLLYLQDQKYKEFHCRLMPDIDPNTVIGVRTPEIWKLAKETLKCPGAAEEYLQELPHQYYDENNLHGALLSLLPDFHQMTAALEAFLPYVDNWATCDLIRPKIFRQHPAGLPELAGKWMASNHTFTARFGIGTLLGFYLDEAFQAEYLEWVAGVQSGRYYVDMMAAWYFATALAKQYEATVPYLERRRLAAWTHNKAIQKAIESRRISAERKAYLRGLKQQV